MSEIEPRPGVTATELWQWRRERAIADYQDMASTVTGGNVAVLRAKMHGLGYRGAALAREVAYIRDNDDAT